MSYAFVPARWFTPGPRTRGAILWIVLHTTEGGGYPDHPASAANGARYNQTRPDKVSTHYIVDGQQTIQCVRLQDVAYAAPGANAQGVQIEMCGFAAWTAEQWHRHPDLLERVAQILADLRSATGVPLRLVEAPGLKASVAGVTEHRIVNQAFGMSDHTDPGPNFPIGEVLARAVAIGGNPPQVVIPSPGTTTPVSLEETMLDFDLAATPDVHGRFPTYEVVTNDGGVEWWIYAWNGARFAKPELQGEMQDGTHYEIKRLALAPGARPAGIRVTTDRVLVAGPLGATYAYDRHI